MKKLLIPLFILLTICLSACGQAEEEKVKGVTLSKTALQLSEGEEGTLIATVTPSTAKNMDVIWTSSNEDVATVAKGVVRGEKSGTATITATTKEGEFTATCAVTVLDSYLHVGKNYTSETEGYGIKYFSRINDALAATDNEDVVFVEEGEYDEIINVNKSITLHGDKATICGYIILGHPSLEDRLSDVTIEGFTFTNTKETTLSDRAAIFIGSEVEKLEITDCKFVGNKTRENDSTSYYAITNIESAINKGATDIEINGCEFTSYTDAIFFKPYSARNEIENCVFTDCKFAVTLTGSQKTAIRGNTITKSGFINFKSAYILPYDVTVEQNVINSVYEKDWENFTPSPMISARYGDIDEGQKLKLYDNTFFTKKPENMTTEELSYLRSLIETESAEKPDLKYENVILVKPKFLGIF